MIALRTSSSLSALIFVLGVAGTSWLTALTYERAPATRPLAEIVLPKASSAGAPKAKSATAPRVASSPVATSIPVARAGTTGHVVTAHRNDVLPAASAMTTGPASLVPVYMPSPRYPMAALRAQREGQVILSVTVTPEGDVTDVAVGRSSGDLSLDHAAEDAVRSWRFAAADNRPPHYTTDLPIRFEITQPF